MNNDVAKVAEITIGDGSMRSQSAESRVISSSVWRVAKSASAISAAKSLSSVSVKRPNSGSCKTTHNKISFFTIRARFIQFSLSRSNLCSGPMYAGLLYFWTFVLHKNKLYYITMLTLYLPINHKNRGLSYKKICDCTLRL